MAAGRIAGAAANAAAADGAYADLLPDMAAWRAAGKTLKTISERLINAGQTTPTGRPWTPGTVANVLRREPEKRTFAGNPIFAAWCPARISAN